VIQHAPSISPSHASVTSLRRDPLAGSEPPIADKRLGVTGAPDAPECDHPTELKNTIPSLADPINVADLHVSASVEPNPVAGPRSRLLIDAEGFAADTMADSPLIGTLAPFRKTRPHG
jgi:hypothetical protein